MIRIITWHDLDNGVIHEATRDPGNPESWTLLRLDIHKQRDPDTVPHELVGEHLDLDEVYRLIGMVDRAQRKRGR